jgi:carboxymethylenebutenolidase
MIEIKAEGGAMPAAVARPTGGGEYPGIVVVMEAFGLNGHIKDVAARIAAEGFITLAPDLYYREPKRVVGYDELPAAIALMTGLYDGKIVGDMDAAISALLAEPGVRGQKVGVTGFCMGGRISFLTACMSARVAAAAPFYGGGIGSVQKSERTPTAPIDLVAGLSCPVLAFYGGDDPFIPAAEIEHVRATLAKRGPQHQVVVYAGAPHGFFCSERDSFRPDAARDAWEKLLRFFRRHLG